MGGPEAEGASKKVVMMVRDGGRGEGFIEN